MSEQEGPQGVQGEQGVRGLQGPTGQGVEGAVGEQGVRGEKGERGASGPLGRRVTWSFLAVIAVATVVTWWFWHENQKLDRTTEKLELTILALDRHTQKLEREIRQRCDDARVNRDAIRTTMIDGLSGLGYKYDAAADEIVENGPAIAYWLEHPAERAVQLTRAKAALARFPAIVCDNP